MPRLHQPSGLSTLLRRMRFEMPAHLRHHGSVAPLGDARGFYCTIGVIMPAYSRQRDGARRVGGPPNKALRVLLWKLGRGFCLHVLSQSVDPTVLADRLRQGRRRELTAIDGEVLEGEGLDQVALTVALARLRRRKQKKACERPEETQHPR